MRKEDLRIVFMGTPEFAVESLKSLVENNFNVVAVVTQPDKPVGRHQEHLQSSPVKQYALAHNLPVLQAEKLKEEQFLSTLRAYKADIQIVVAFRMLPEVVWAMPRLGTFNVHAALLPQYRGAAPINWAIINGEKKTGVTTFFLDKNIDTGRMILQREFPIPDEADVEYVYNGLMRLGAEIAIDTVSYILKQLPESCLEGINFSKVLDKISTPQVNEESLHKAPKIFKETCRICWNTESKKIYDFVRGLSPYPGTWTTMLLLDDTLKTSKNNIVLKVFKTSKTMRIAESEPGTLLVEKGHLYVNTTDYLLELLDMQLPGKKRMDVKSFLNGFKMIAHYKLE